MFALNQEYLEDESYFNVLDSPKSIPRSDYDPESCDVIPVADPNETTNAQKLIKGQIWISKPSVIITPPQPERNNPPIVVYTCPPN